MNDFTAALFNAVTEHDQKQAKKPGYNIWALGHYARGLQLVEKHVDNGADLRDAITNCFVGQLCDKLLKAVKLPKLTQTERGGA